MLRWFKKNIDYMGDFAFLEADIHSHILFGIDDGAKTIDDSRLYIERLHSFGFKRLIFTPHILSDLYPNNIETIAPVFSILKSGDLPVDMDFAAEYMLDNEFEALIEANQFLTINNKYILVEMSYLAPFRNFKEVIFKLKVKGYQPILAHPERYGYWHRDTEKFEEAKMMGCLFQMNLLSVTGYYGSAVKHAAQKLMAEQMYDFAATDLHHERHLNALDELRSTKMLSQLVNYGFKNSQFCSAKV